MSANTKQSKQEGKAQNAGMARSEIRKAIKAAPNDIHVDKLSRVTLKVPTELKGSMVILMVGPDDVQEQFTIHPPIGVTDLAEDDWVMTRTTDVHYLLARKDDPNAQKVIFAQNKNKNAFLIDKKLLIEKEKELFYPCDEKHPRNSLLDEAEKALKADKHKSKSARKVDYMDSVHRSAELAIIAALKTDEAKRCIYAGDGRQTYRTRGGVLEDQPQLAMKAFKGQDPHKAFATLSKVTNQVIGKGEGVVVQQSKDCDHYDLLVQKDDQIARLDQTLSAYEERMKGAIDVLDAVKKGIEDSVKPGLEPEEAEKERKAVKDSIAGLVTMLKELVDDSD